MGKKQDKLYRDMMAMIERMQRPENNPAQNYLTQSAIEGAEFMKKGDFTKLPKGMFFDFQMPAEQLRQYQRTANVGKEGLFAIGDNSGAGKAMATQSAYLGDRFARDASQNYQNNIKDAAGSIRSGLAQASGAQVQNNGAVIGALQGLGGMGFMNKPSGWGSILGMAGSLGSAAISKW